MRLFAEIALICGVAVGAIALARSHGDGDDAGGRARAHHAGALSAPNFDGLRDFSGVVVTGPDHVIITRGANYSVRAEGDSKTLAGLTATVSDGMLRIGRKSERSWGFWGGGGGGDAVVRVTLPALSDVALTGSGAIEADTLSGDKATVNLFGSGDLSIGAIAAKEVAFVLTGSGDITASGRAQSASYTLKGSGDVNAASFTAGTASVSVYGSGDIVMRAEKDVQGRLNGSGNVEVAGTSQCHIAIYGSGEVACKG